MIGREKIEERYLTIAEAKELLERRYKEGLVENPERPAVEEVKFSIEHAEKFAKLHPEDASKLKQTLMEKFEWMDERLAVKIVDIMPKDMDDLRVIFSKETHQLTKEEGEEILAVLDEYRESES
ncbi:MAG: DNA-directed RNA polymerase subunit F [Thermococci archaeon]|nr:DNA-directed RNA polymerase subunit F [Thermococci archaeon]